ncbi:MAG TPA: alpha/beta hydrolase [Aestuariivirga sp.]|nr:alpha/beta hydrolase [Aestuariivirga sp.]
MIPALGCDDGLYADILPRLLGLIEPVTIIADKDTLTGCVQQVLEQAPEKFIILGTSFGGRTALEVAFAAPQRVQGLVVIGAGPGVAADPSARFRRTERLRGNEFENVVTEMADMVSHMPGPNGAKARNAFISMAHELGGALMARQSAALAKRLDLWPRLDEITCPSLFLWGREDKFSPAADGLKMSTSLLHGRYAEISECGHFPSLEAPEETADIILHWLQDSKFI